MEIVMVIKGEVVTLQPGENGLTVNIRGRATMAVASGHSTQCVARMASGEYEHVSVSYDAGERIAKHTVDYDDSPPIADSDCGSDVEEEP